MTGWWSEGWVGGVQSWINWVLKDQVWEYQVRTCSDSACTGWSSIVSAKAVVETAPGPSNIRTLTWGTDGIEFTWDAVQGYDVDRYAVYVWDQSEPGAWLSSWGTRGTNYVVRGLTPGHTYATWVATYTNTHGRIAGGLPAAGRYVRVNGRAPPAPSVIKATNEAPTTVNLHWPAVPDAAGYAIYMRSHLDNKPLVLAGTTSETHYGTAFLFPGTWNYEFCLASYNGNMETAPTACVTPPKWPGYKRDEIEIPDNYTLVENVTSTYNSTTMLDDLTLKMLYQLQLQEFQIQQEGNLSFVLSNWTAEKDI
jgi:hypothetical protein